MKERERTAFFHSCTGKRVPSAERKDGQNQMLYLWSPDGFLPALPADLKRVTMDFLFYICDPSCREVLLNRLPKLRLEQTGVLDIEVLNIEY